MSGSKHKSLLSSGSQMMRLEAGSGVPLEFVRSCVITKITQYFMIEILINSISSSCALILL